MNKLKLITATSALVAALLFTGGALAFQADAVKGKVPSKAATKAAAAAAPSATDIADAKTKHMVWVNTNTKVYHKDGEFFGKTKQGKFMMEADAQKAGYRAAKEPAAKKKPADKK